MNHQANPSPPAPLSLRIAAVLALVVLAARNGSTSAAPLQPPPPPPAADPPSAIPLPAPATLARMAVGIPATLDSPRSPGCPRFTAMLQGCQPLTFTGVAGCASQCPASPGTACTVELSTNGGFDAHPPVIPILLAEIEGWWLVWSEAEQRRYLVYDGVHVVGNTTRHFALCAPGCGLHIEGYGWVEPDGERRGEVDRVETACIPCDRPTPTPERPARRLPPRCVWHAFVPLALTDSPPPPATAPAFPRAFVGGHASAVAIDAATVFAAAGQRLEMLGLPAPVLPWSVDTHLVLSAPIQRLAAAEGMAYAITADGKLHVVDPHATGRPRVTAVVERPAPIEGVFVTPARVAYLAVRERGLEIFDLRDPARPVRLGGLAMPDAARDVVAAGDVAYVAVGAAGLAVVDVRRPGGPYLRATLDMAGPASRVVLDGRYAYVVAADDVHLVDIRRPFTPRRLLTLRTPGPVQDAAVGGGRLFVADGPYGLAVFDIRNPLAPVATHRLSVPDWAVDVVAAGDRVLVASRAGGLWAIDARDPAAIVETRIGPDLGYPFAAERAGSRVWVAADPPGLAAVDLDAPGGPGVVARVPLRGTAVDVKLAGNVAHLFVRGPGGASAYTGVDIADPRAPQTLWEHRVEGYSGKIALGEGHAYVLGGLGAWRIAVFALHARSSPDALAPLEMPERVYDVHAARGHLYASMGEEGLAILSLSDPAAPVAVGTYRGGGWAHEVAVEGTVAYVAAGMGGLDILDVRDPTAPRRLRRMWLGGPAERVSVAGGTAYVIVRGAGVIAVDASQPEDARVLGAYAIPGAANDVVAAPDGAVVLHDIVGLVWLWPWRAIGARSSLRSTHVRRPRK